MNGKPLVLVILDGFGCNQNDNYNAIKNAATPNWDSIWAQYPKTTILPKRTRAFVDFMASRYGKDPVWNKIHA